MSRARILLVDDHATVAEQLRRLLEAEFDVVATVSDGYGMIGAAQVLKPDLIVSDIAMPGMDGIAAAGWVLKADPAARIVFVTVHREAEIMKRAMDAGAMGYVLKLSAGEELIPALQAVLRGEHYVSNLNGSVNGH
jgi:DNA-binding NarL/FixJ family response regulator